MNPTGPTAKPTASPEALRAELAQVCERNNEAWRARSAAQRAYSDADAAWGVIARRQRELEELLRKPEEAA
jgi:hypothetical protein